MMDEEKFKLFRDVEIPVYWNDPLSGERKRGILWNYTWIEGVMSPSPNDNRLIDAHYYAWDVKGDDGKFYSFPEMELSLDP